MFHTLIRATLLLVILSSGTAHTMSELWTASSPARPRINREKVSAFYAKIIMLEKCKPFTTAEGIHIGSVSPRDILNASSKMVKEAQTKEKYHNARLAVCGTLYWCADEVKKQCGKEVSPHLIEALALEIINANTPVKFWD